MHPAVRHKLISKRSLDRRILKRSCLAKKPSASLNEESSEKCQEIVDGGLEAGNATTSGNSKMNEKNDNIGIGAGLTVDLNLDSFIECLDDTNPKNDNSDVNNEYHNSLSWADGIRKIAQDHNLTHLAVSDILKFLIQKGIPDIPKDARTLLVTPKCVQTENVAPGQYIRFNLRDNITQIVLKIQNVPEVLRLSFSVDGLPISRSSKGQFWPILARLDDLNLRPFVAGMYYGHKKPDDPNEYLKYFVNDLIQLLQDGIIVNDKSYSVEINNFVCDAPARAFIKGVKGHNAYYGCERCHTEGEYSHKTHTVYFPDFNCVKRTNESFRNRLQEEHHTTRTVLENLPINMVNDFPLDYLHQILLGVMKKILLFWLRGNVNYKTKLSANDQKLVSARLIAAGQNLPKEFSRSVRPLDVIAFWKATEYRTFLLYTGVIALKSTLTPDVYCNFLMLHCAMTICLSNHHLSQYLHIAEKCFVRFVEQYISLYGVEYVSFNIHNVLHIIDDVKKNGSLDNASAFPFESELYKIKSLIRTGYLPLQQVSNRLSELFSNSLSCIKANEPLYPILKQKQKVSHSRKECKGVYLYIELDEMLTLTNSRKNKWFLTKKFNIVEFINVTYNEDRKIVIYGSMLKSCKKSLYERPIESALLNIYKCTLEKYSPEIFHLDDVYCKLFCIEINADESAFFPVLHTNVTCYETSDD